MRAVVYARLSAEQDDEVKDSVPQQLRDGVAAVERAGWTLVGEHADRSVSAWDGGRGGGGKAKDRPAWNEVLRLARAGEADVVVVRHVDRLLRNPRARADLRETGLQVADHSGNVLPDFALGLMSEVATFESDVRSDRQLKAEQRRVEAGLPPRGGHRHYGYTTVAEGHEVIPEEAEVLREMAERWLGGEALRALARELNERGLRTTLGNEWTYRTLGKLLRSPRLAGLRVHKGAEHEGSWEPIFDRELHARLVAADSSSKVAREAPTRYLLTGLIWCGRCETETLNGKRHRQTPGGRRYACYGCQRNSIAAEPVDEHLWNEALSKAWKRDRDVAGRLEERLEGLEAGLAEAKARVKELDDAYWVARSIDKERWARLTGELQSQVEGMEAEAKRLRAERDAEAGYWTSLLRLAETFEEAPPADRRRVLERTLERVTLKPWTADGSQEVDLERLEVEWRA